MDVVTWVVWIVYVALLCGVALGIGFLIRAWGNPSRLRVRIGKVVMVLSVVAFVGWVGGNTAYSTVKVVEDEHVAIVYQSGEIVGLKGSGLQFIPPWQEIRTSRVGALSARFDEVTGIARFDHEVTASITVDYHVTPEAVLELHRTVGPNWDEILVPPRIHGFFERVVSRYKAEEITANPERIQKEVHERLAESLEEFAVTIELLLIEDWSVATATTGR